VALPPKVANNPYLAGHSQPNHNPNTEQGDSKQLVVHLQLGTHLT